MRSRKITLHLTVPCVVALFALAAYAQTTAFSYQGQLTDGGNPASGSFQLQFRLFDALASGNQIGSTINDVQVTATQGTFSVKLDFGANALSGANRWLEIAVRRNSSENYTTLSPREQISSSPYAVRTLSASVADTATNAQNLGGVAANQFVQTSDSRLTDSRNPLAGSSNYIQNGVSPQPSSSFNISGSGTIGSVLGVGRTPTAGIRVDAQGTIRAVDSVSNSIISETTGGTNAWARFYMKTPNRTWFMGTSQNFNGDQLYINDDTAGATRMAILANGNVGIGTGGPTTRLSVSGGVPWTSTGWTASMNMDDFRALGWEANNSGTRFGIGQANSGLNFFRTTSAFGSTSSPATLDMLITTAGNVGIGTGGPVTRLAVGGGTPWTSSGWKGAFSMDNATAIGWLPNASNQLFGIGQSNGGLYFFRTSSFLNQTNNPATYDMVISDAGRVGIGTITPGAKLTVSNGNIFVTQPNSLIITSPNGACWFLTVSNAGALSTFSVACP